MAIRGATLDAASLAEVNFPNFAAKLQSMDELGSCQGSLFQNLSQRYDKEPDGSHPSLKKFGP